MNTFLALFNLGGGEIILILALILILFGARKLPELAKGLGQGIKEFKKATRKSPTKFNPRWMNPLLLRSVCLPAILSPNSLRQSLILLLLPRAPKRESLSGSCHG